MESSRAGEAWAGMYVGFDLLTHRQDQYIGYWDPERRLTVARRRLDGPAQEWIHQVLDERLGWDSHNHISLGVDRDGCLHVSGNMHNDPLVLFRATGPGEVTTLQRCEHLVNPTTEQSVTYPEFLNLPDGTLVFSHRDGGSGDGVTYLNAYDEPSGSWRRLLDEPLFDGSADDGEGPWSAYFEGPTFGPDGRFHLVWVWRETPDAATNSMLSHACSEDLVTWTDVHGAPLAVPIRHGQGGVVDPVPAGGGLLNGLTRLGFDAAARPHIVFHKYDDAGLSQLYLARPAGPTGGWTSQRLTDWTRRWDFGGHGTLVFEVQILESQTLGDGRVRVDARAFGEEISILLDTTLRPVEEGPTPPWPDHLGQVRGEFPGLRANLRRGRGDASSGEEHVLRWESLPENRDQPYAQHPWSSPLEVATLRTGGSG